MKKHNLSSITSNGFTLIEVLIALAIISISLTAIIKATSQNIKDTVYLQDKMVANWVALQVINEARVNLIKLSPQVESTNKEIEALGKTWTSETTLIDTPNPKIKEIVVTVSRKKDNVKLATIKSYKYFENEK